MPIRNDHAKWSDAERAYLKARLDAGDTPTTIAAHWPERFPVRNLNAINNRKREEGWHITKRPRPDKAMPGEQNVESKRTDEGWEAKSVGRKIKTVEDLLRHIEADLTKFEIAQQEATKYEATTKDPETGKPVVTEMHRVFVRLRPKAGPSTQEVVRELIAEARKDFAVLRYPKHKGDADILQAIPIFDPHIGKLAWPAETGDGPWDTPISIDTLRAGVLHLMAEGDARGVGERAFCVGGDFFHHDGRGMTTSGTVLDYDSRFPKMYRGGTRLLIDLIATSAAKMPTRVYIVPGNHDATLSFALQEALVIKFEQDKRVAIDERFTSTKFFSWGRCLIGLDHGDKGKKRLPHAMATMCEAEWGNSIVREILTGHLHSKAMIETMGNVVVRTMDSLATSDKFHAEEKFNTSPRTIEAFRYHKGGMVAGTDSWSPDLNRAPRKGTG